MTQILYSVFKILLFSSIAYAQEAKNGSQFASQIKLTDSTSTVIWNQNFKQLVQVVAEPGFKIVVTVNECHMNSDSSEYVTISTDSEGTENMLKMTYTVSNNPSFLYNSNELYAKYVGSDTSSSVSLNFTRVGSRLITTTTEIPTTTVILPTPDPHIEKDLTVYLAGWESHEYAKLNSKDLIKQVISKATNKYCQQNGYDLVRNATESNVLLKISQCPDFWPDSDICVKMTIAVPVLILENKDLNWTGYQLTRHHLAKMWDEIGQNYLPKGISIYDIPDTEEWFDEQIYLFAALLIVCVICALLVRYCSSKMVEPSRRRKLSDTKSIISSKRDSINDLRPHPLQETPPLFDNIYPMFNPVTKKVAHAPISDERPDSSIQKKERDIEYASEDEDESQS